MKIIMNEGAAKSRQNNLTPAQAKFKQNHQQRTEIKKQKMQSDSMHLFQKPEEMFNIEVSVYWPKRANAERLTVNVDFIFAPGTKPFKTTASCVSRSRKREILHNVKQYSNWPGYQLATDALSSAPDGTIYAGKLKNLVEKYYAISRWIIPQTVLIMSNHGNHYEVSLLLGDAQYHIDCYPVKNVVDNEKTMTWFSHKGSLRLDSEQMLDVEAIQNGFTE